MRLRLTALLLLSAAALAGLPSRGVRAQAVPPPSPSPSQSASAAPGESAAPPDASAAAQSPPPIPSPLPAPDDPKMHKLAVQQFLSWQAGTVDRTAYSDDINSQLNDEMLDRATKTLANLGGLQQVTFRGISHPKGLDVYVYTMHCERGSVDMEFAVEPDGKIAMIFFA